LRLDRGKRRTRTRGDDAGTAYYHMPPGTLSQGVRAEAWQPRRKELTKGEAERLARRPGPKLINGTVVPNGRR
jgi:hypothetical protein